MVYSYANSLDGRDFLLSTGDVMKRLGITKVTLYTWIGLDKIKVKRRPIGKRTFLEFDPKEVERVKNLMVNKRHQGKPLFK